MKKQWMGMLAGILLVTGCGGGGSLPTDGAQDALPSDDEPLLPGRSDSLWPLTTGSTWTYRITDELEAPFEKTVRVLGPQTVPETQRQAIAVESNQPHLQELSWQLETEEGLVVRLREEDRRGDFTLRTTTWEPSTVKSLAEAKALDWAHTSSVTEHIVYGDGTGEDKGRVYVWRVTGVNERVTVPAGTFTNATRVVRDRQDKEGSKDRVYWLVPGVGKVKEEGERTEELLHYEVKE